MFVQTLIHGLLGLWLPFTNLCLPFFSAQLGGNKQPRSPTLDHTLLGNSTLVGGRAERGRRDRIEIREEGIKAFISPEYGSLTHTSALLMTLITAMRKSEVIVFV